MDALADSESVDLANFRQIYLAMEEREKNATAKATALIGAWSSSFFNMSFTLHTYGLPNEAPGKSSNESWAARQIISDYPSTTRKQDIVVTTMDGEQKLKLLMGNETNTSLSRHTSLVALLCPNFKTLSGVSRNPRNYYLRTSNSF